MSAHATTLVGAQESRGLGCHHHPQARRLRAGKVAQIVHRHTGFCVGKAARSIDRGAEFVRARLPRPSTAMCSACGQPCRCIHDGNMRTWCGCACRQGAPSRAVSTARHLGCALFRLRAISTARHQRATAVRDRTQQGTSSPQELAKVSVRWRDDANVPQTGGTSELPHSTFRSGTDWRVQPGRYLGFTPGSGGVPREVGVTGEVTATRRFDVLHMSVPRSKVPLHLVPTRV